METSNNIKESAHGNGRACSKHIGYKRNAMAPSVFTGKVFAGARQQSGRVHRLSGSRASTGPCRAGGSAGPLSTRLRTGSVLKNGICLLHERPIAIGRGGVAKYRSKKAGSHSYRIQGGSQMKFTVGLLRTARPQAGQQAPGAFVHGESRP